MGNGRESGEGQAMSHAVASSLPSLTSLAVAAFPPAIHLLGMFWGTIASLSLSDGAVMGLDHYPLPVLKAPTSHC